MAPILAEAPTPVSAPAVMTPELPTAPVLLVVWPVAPTVLTAALLELLDSDTEPMAPVALMETPAPLPEMSPVVMVPPVLRTPVALLLVDVCVMVPMLVPAPSVLPSEATLTEATEPVAPTEADAPLPKSAPTASPAAPLDVLEVDPVFDDV